MGSSESKTPKIHSQPLEGSKVDGFSHIYRNPKSVKELLVSPNPNLHSIKDVVISSFKKYGQNQFVGNIELRTKVENGENKEQRTMTKYTYSQIYEQAQRLGSFLLENKLYHEDPKTQMKLIGVFSKNRYEWVLADIACILYGMSIIPLYDTLGIQNLTYCLDHSEIKTCFVTKDTVQTLLKLKGHGQLKSVISFDDLSSEIEGDLQKHEFNVIYLKKACDESVKIISYDSIKVDQNSCLTFSYTSGTTGPPKGAMLSHGNFLSFLAAFQSHEFGGFKQTDVYVSFLPLPHVLERLIMMCMIYSGSFVAFFNGDIFKVKDDLLFVKPTIFVAVPRLYNRIVQGIQKKLNEATGIKGCIASSGLESKHKNLQETGSFTAGFYDSVVFSKVREGFGGNIRLMITGSAPIKKDIYEFMKVVMCCPFLEGYGQTENTGAAFIQGIIQTESGQVGAVTNNLEFKLMDIEEMHYTSNDKDQKGNSTPRGEIWLRGPAVFMGYYKDQQKTKQAVTSDGWLKTGDVGMLLPHTNALKIIDRKKNIFKLQQGEYVASEKVQAVYTKCPIISDIFLHGESHHSFAVAILTVNQKLFMQLASKNKIEGNFQEICNKINMRTVLCKEMDSVGKKNGLMSFEQAKNIYVDTETFQNRNILTETKKLKRFEAKKLYAKQIQDMYKEDMLPLK